MFCRVPAKRGFLVQRAEADGSRPQQARERAAESEHTRLP